MATKRPRVTRKASKRKKQSKRSKKGGAKPKRRPLTPQLGRATFTAAGCVLAGQTFTGK